MQRQPLNILFGFGIFCCLLQFSCASLTTVSFKSKDDVAIRAVEWSDLNGSGTDLGRTPVDIDVEKIKGKVLVLTSPDKHAQYWVIPHTTGKRLEANIQLEEKRYVNAGTGDSKQKEFPVREYSRLLMKSYQALIEKDYKVATDLATKLSQFAPEDSAPAIITGLCALQSGDRPKARAEFEKAKALDPNNPEIVELLRLSR